MEVHCPDCKTSFPSPRERMMPDRVIEYRCPACEYQIPLLAPGNPWTQACPQCSAGPEAAMRTVGVDKSGLLSFLYCGACRCLLGRYWGILQL